jgi:hypothetical protein
MSLHHVAAKRLSRSYEKLHAALPVAYAAKHVVRDGTVRSWLNWRARRQRRSLKATWKGRECVASPHLVRRASMRCSLA